MKRLAAAILLVLLLASSAGAQTLPQPDCMDEFGNWTPCVRRHYVSVVFGD